MKENKELVSSLIKRLNIEFERLDRSGVYGETQRLLAYNSNRIEGSTLTFSQTSSMFETGTLNSENDILIRAKDIEEMNGHFLMFNNMLKTYKEPLTEELIKSYHYDLKSGVFEDKANGYPVGEYKNRSNRVSDILTTEPKLVEEEMKKLLNNYNKIENITINDIAEFHAKYESIHPFQDGNGRTGRIIMFKECLKNNIFPFIIEDDKKAEYYSVLNKAQKGDLEPLEKFIEKEQLFYYEKIHDMLE